MKSKAARGKTSQKTRNILQKTWKELNITRVELTAKKRELEIESSLERVRKIAMGMKRPEDMLVICKTISKQLALLGIKEIRNIQTAIFYEQRGTYMNYQYYAKHNKTFITDTLYTDHKVARDFAAQMLKGKGKFYITHLKGRKKLKDWIAYQKKTNVFIDKFLYSAPSLSYYWYSLGPVALGVSTYFPLTKEEENLFKRFLNVFELSYRRYLDIEKAEAQAREAKIEASLEKVRAVATGMHKPDDLLNVCEVMYKEFLSLGFSEIRNAIININNDTDGSFINYDYAEAAGKSFGHFKNNVLPFVDKIIKIGKSKEDAFSETYISGIALAEFKRLRKKTGQKNDPKLNKAKSLYFYFYSIGIGTIGISTFGAISKEKKELLKRFRNVFALAYQRFIDIGKAEAQSREAQIELALEKVRARTMSMQKSEELPETTFLLFQQLKELGQEAAQLSLGIIKEEAGYVELSATVHGKTITQTHRIPLDEHYVMKKAVKAWKEKKHSIIIRLKGKELKEYNAWRNKVVKKKIIFPEKQWIVNVVFFSKGLLSFSSEKEISKETFQLLERFAAVFDLTYTRFLDLKKAEAQTREAEIELALERVRAKTMAMQKSDELKETTLVLFQQFKSLGATTAQVSICIFDEETTKGEMFVTLKGEKIDRSFPMNLDEESFVMKRAKKAFLENKKNFSITITGKELQTYNHWRNTLIGKKGWDESVAVRKQSWYVNAVFFSRGMMGISSDSPPSDEALKLLERFGNVFDLTFTRFLDLQKAEEQAREAQIETALERVRTRTMAMQKSEELLDVIAILSDQLSKLKIRFDNVSFGVNIHEDDFKFWLSAAGQPRPVLIQVPYIDNPAPNRVREAQKKDLKFFADTLTEKENKQWVRHMLKHSGNISYSEKVKKYLLKSPGFARSTFILKNINLYIGNYKAIPYTEEENGIFKRFAYAFEQSYTRFLDLQKAEAQAREAHIEASLERVRAKTMAMHTSSDMLEVVKTLGEQFELLDFKFNSVNFNIDTHEKDWNLWLYNVGSAMYPGKIHVPYIDHPCFNRPMEAFKKGGDLHSFIFTKEEKDSFFDYIYTNTVAKYGSDERKRFTYDAPGFAMSTAVTKNTRITISNFKGEPFSDDENAILRRFANVFEQSYTRFLDLQKAEAQAREAQIEAALERVRALAMSMMKSEELIKVCQAVFTQLKALGFDHLRNAQIYIRYDEKKKFTNYNYADYSGAEVVEVLYESHPNVKGFYDVIAKANDVFAEYEISGNELKDWKSYLYKTLGQKIDIKLETATQLHYYFYSIGTGALGVCTFKPIGEEELKILKRFRNVFDLSYKRYTDIALAEAQAREAKIEAGLERVRSRSMGMQKSDELKEVIQLVYEQFIQLKINVEHTGFIIDYKERDDLHIWLADQHLVPSEVFVPYFDCPPNNSIKEAKEKGKDFFEYLLDFEEKNKFYRDLFKLLPDVPEETVEYYLTCPGLAGSGVLLDNIGLYIENFSGTPYSDEENKILMRFGKVFQQTYTRFLDLQKAEAQARESQIELGLERVRARAMAMQKSNELSELVDTVFKELTKLDFALTWCIINIIDEPSLSNTVWAANPNTNMPPESYHMLFEDYPFHHAMMKGWKERKTKYVYTLEGNEKKVYDEYLFNETEFRKVPEAAQAASKAMEKYVVTFSFSNFGGLQTVGDAPLSDANLDILSRFGKVFDLTYTRFNDLKQAEAQAREGQIQLALERVRARTMAMQRSDELAETAVLLFKQINDLGIETWTSGFNVWEKDDVSFIGYNPTPSGGIADPYHISSTEDRFFIKIHEAKKRGEDFLVFDWKEKSLAETYRYMKTLPVVKDVLKGIEDAGFQLPTFQINHCIFFTQGFLLFITLKPYPEAHNIFKRFGKVFDQSYTRFLDLQKAEAQAREAIIEAALEKVRGKAMAMHNSNDLSATASLMFTELNKLGIKPIRSGVGLISKNDHTAKIYSATSSKEGNQLALMGEITLSGHPVFENQYEFWLKKENYVTSLKGEELSSYYKILSAGLKTDLNVSSESREEIGYWIMFTEGFLYAWSEKRFTESELNILERFKNVVELTFRRYFDLQKAEASTKEAIKQAALDRIRADIASMRTTNDLERIIPLIWNELTLLGIPFIRCGVFIMDEEKKIMHTFLSTPEGKAIAAFHLPYDTPGNVSQILTHWHNRKNYIDHWDEEAFTEFAHTLVKQGVLASPEQYLKTLPRGGFYLHFLPFLQGMLYVGNTNQLSEEETTLLQSVADAFSTAYARYEDFNKLESAKKQVDSALNELQAAQKQLIQSEKMASLGELTAGIAHEIQNPLNFVNNFSEVNKELLLEMKEEIEKGNFEEAKILAKDVTDNQEKINFHGKRADAIVKSMLQHSRSSSGKKELVDINALADEYLRLSYHGLRAKDKSFNAKFVTDLDPSIDKINIVPQEMGRVILNLINNAFYAVSERKKQNEAGYEPTVSVTTKKENGKIEIKVKDNGPGISPKVLDKIFQPFFTTKPTGQGTGLGLSLSYDIITKGHSGELKVETKEGEGSAFIVLLPNV